MSNVLTPEERKNVLRRLNARFLFLGALVLFIGAGIATLTLLPAWISIRIADANLREQQKAAAAGVREDQEKAIRAQALVDGLKPFTSASSTASEIIAIALSRKPAAVSVTSLRYNKGSLVLSGISSNREAVNTFRDALASDGKFTKVVIPVDALVGAQEGRFTVTLSF